MNGMNNQNQELALSKSSTEQDTESQLLAQKREEDRRIVTPYAFEVSDALVGTPLASNWHRGFALCIDMLIIVTLAELDSMLLAGLLGWVFYRASNKLEKKQRYPIGRKLLRFLAVFLFFLLALGLFEEISGEDKLAFLNGSEQSEQQTSIKLEGGKALAFATVAAEAFNDMGEVRQQLEQGQCEPELDCWSNYGYGVVDDLLVLELNNKQVSTLIASVIEETNLTPEQKTELVENMRHYYQQNKPQGEAPEQNTTSETASSVDVTEPVIQVFGDDEPENQPVQSQDGVYSLLEWAKGIASDLGLGFGWAAFYFTVLTAWWNGQTPGKRLFAIKVCKLDGSGLNLWESFGRYGGYGAGLATGLLGFLQIFWDPNRQGIQDKISETLVIKVVKQK